MMDKFNTLYNKIISNTDEIIEEGIGKTLATIGTIGALAAGAVGLNNKLKDNEAKIPPFPEPEFVTDVEMDKEMFKEPELISYDEIEKQTPQKQEKKVKQLSEAEIHKQAIDTAFNFIKDREGSEMAGGKHVKYKDVKGKWTIGYGITDPDIVAKGAISEAEAVSLLRKEILEVDKVLRRRFKNYINCNSNQRAALISFHFNLGKWFNAPKMNSNLENSNWEQCAFEFLDCDKATFVKKDKNGKELLDANGKPITYKKRVPGLTKRRKAEHDLFLTPVN
jgi:GH24 family phage-related lysozyme (muramidase)